jgi:hypothetical protein
MGFLTRNEFLKTIFFSGAAASLSKTNFSHPKEPSPNDNSLLDQMLQNALEREGVRTKVNFTVLAGNHAITEEKLALINEALNRADEEKSETYLVGELPPALLSENVSTDIDVRKPGVGITEEELAHHRLAFEQLLNRQDPFKVPDVINLDPSYQLRQYDYVPDYLTTPLLITVASGGVAIIANELLKITSIEPKSRLAIAALILGAGVSLDGLNFLNQSPEAIRKNPEISENELLKKSQTPSFQSQVESFLKQIGLKNPDKPTTHNDLLINWRDIAMALGLWNVVLMGEERGEKIEIVLPTGGGHSGMIEAFVKGPNALTQAFIDHAKMILDDYLPQVIQTKEFAENEKYFREILVANILPFNQAQALTAETRLNSDVKFITASTILTKIIKNKLSEDNPTNKEQQILRHLLYRHILRVNVDENTLAPSKKKNNPTIKDLGEVQNNYLQGAEIITFANFIKETVGSNGSKESRECPYGVVIKNGRTYPLTLYWDNDKNILEARMKLNHRETIVVSRSEYISQPGKKQPKNETELLILQGDQKPDMIFNYLNDYPYKDGLPTEYLEMTARPERRAPFSILPLPETILVSI